MARAICAASAHGAPAILLVISRSRMSSHWRLIISKRRFGHLLTPSLSSLRPCEDFLYGFKGGPASYVPVACIQGSRPGPGQRPGPIGARRASA